MSNTIPCPHCGKEVEISEAFRHQIEEQVLAIEKEKHAKALDDAKTQAQEIAEKKVREQFELLIKNTQEETLEEKKRNKDLQNQLLELTKQMRLMRQKDEERALEMEKKLAESEEKIRQEAKKKADEENRLKILEKDKQLSDAIKANEELRRKLEQGSQQTQGEVLELEVEELLRTSFPLDSIKPVAKGIRGADAIQEIVDRNGHRCGTILWESKNAKWSEGWLAKLKEDQRLVKADVSVLISVHMPADIKNFGNRNGVCITNRECIIPFASILRASLIKLYYTKLSTVGKNEKMEIMWNYLTGTEFSQRLEAISEAFSSMNRELETEKKWFATKWARQEKIIQKVLTQTHGLHGDLQGIAGSALPGLKSLELSEGLGDK